MNILWPEGVKYNDVLFFLTFSVHYMVKSSNAIRNIYLTIIHVTCLAYAVHRVAKIVCINNPKFDKLLQM